jgi:hypothetical protein
MKLYISGPITGMPDLNRKAFKDMANDLFRLGNQAINPHDIGENIEAEFPYDKTPQWIDYMKADCSELCKCDGVVVLPGYEKSKGALIETAIATMLEMPIYTLAMTGLQRIDLLVRELNEHSQ